MKEKITDVVFVLDKSGSMSGLESDTIGGFNSMLKEQKKGEGICRITTVLFDTDYTVLHDKKDVREVEPLTEEDYIAGGGTALLDALGKSISHIIKFQKECGKENCADKVLFVIITDGQENSSREYSLEQIKKIIKKRQEKHGWEFLFLGANIDAFSAAESIGINRSHAQNFHCDAKGLALNFVSVSNLMGSVRATGRIANDWSAEIARDFKKRIKGKTI